MSYNQIPQIVTRLCLGWILCYITFGASSTGKDLFSNVIWFKDTKGGLPVAILTYPVLIATCLGTLLLRREGGRSGGRLSTRRYFQSSFCSYHRHGDGNFGLYTVLFIFLPLCSYTIMGIRRHLHELHVDGPFPLLTLLYDWRRYHDNDGEGEEDSNSTSHIQSEAVSEIANSIAMMAIIAIGLFLIPASKNGPILKIFGWSQTKAIRLHIYAGRILVVGSLLHGLLHTIRWKYQLGEDISTFILPPRQCWILNDDSESFTPLICKNKDTKCTCHEHFIYFTGLLSAMLAITILLTTSPWVRRKSYQFFLLSHFLLAPLFFLVVMFHYQRAVLYISPSLLYYLATTIPPYFERQRNVGVTVSSVEVIGTEREEQYISLTFEATSETIQAFRPGMYTQLYVPSISSVGHPFTVNRVVGQEDLLRIIFKVHGPFTRSLATKLQTESVIPTIQMSGLHGSPNRMYQTRHHDINIFVAGGIGITPFLSLLRHTIERNADDGSMALQESYSSSRVRELSLHWSCRSASLIQYILREYLDTLQEKVTPHCRTQLHLYHSTKSPVPSPDTEKGDCQEGQTSIRRLEYPAENVHVQVNVTKPFQLPRFSPSRHIRGNLLPTMAMILLLWPGLGIIWYSYSNYQSDDELRGQAIAPLALLAYMGLVSYIFTRIIPYHWFRKNTQDLNFKSVKQDSKHSLEELLPLSPSTSTGSLSHTETPENHRPDKVTLECHEGRPCLVAALNPLEKARWPAVYSCGPSSMSNHIQAIVDETSRPQNSVTIPMVTIYDEAFLL